MNLEGNLLDRERGGGTGRFAGDDAVDGRGEDRVVLPAFEDGGKCEIRVG